MITHQFQDQLTIFFGGSFIQKRQQKCDGQRMNIRGIFWFQAQQDILDSFLIVLDHQRSLLSNANIVQEHDEHSFQDLSSWHLNVIDVDQNIVGEHFPDLFVQNVISSWFLGRNVDDSPKNWHEIFVFVGIQRWQRVLVGLNEGFHCTVGHQQKIS